MTLQKDGRTFIASCDECPETIDTERDDFTEARTAITKFGWRTFRGPDGKWANACPLCVAEFAKGKR